LDRIFCLPLAGTIRPTQLLATLGLSGQTIS